MQPVEGGRGVAHAADVEGDFATVMGGAPAEGTTSMQRDLAAGRPSELDAQIGAVVRFGQELGVAVPYHAGVLRQLKPQGAGTPGRLAGERGPAATSTPTWRPRPLALAPPPTTPACH